MGNPEPALVSLASRDGSGLRAGLEAYDGYDVVVARLVPTEEFGILDLVVRICKGD